MADPVSNFPSPIPDHTAADFVGQGIILNRGLQSQAFADLTGKIEAVTAALSGLGGAPMSVVTLPSLTSHIDPFSDPAVPSQLTVTPVFPDANAILAVNPNFGTEPGYMSYLLDDVKATLSDLVLGTKFAGTDPAVLQQLWDQGRERTARVTQGKIDDIVRITARSGWNVATGDEQEEIFRAMDAQVAQDITESRTISVAEADLQQKNFQFSITQAIALESLTSNLYDALEKRLLEAEKTRIESINEINKISTEVYKSRIDAESTRVQAVLQYNKINAEVYTAEVGAEVAKIEAQVAVQTAELTYEGKKADINIAVYNANTATFLAQKELAIGTLRTLAQVYSQLVASFGSAVNYGANVSGSNSFSESNSTSQSASWSHSVSQNI